MASPWNAEECRSLIGELRTVRATLQAQGRREQARLEAIPPGQQASALNLLHYLALRRVDMRSVQRRLAALGLSSLGRAESHVLASVDKVLGLLHLLAGLPWRSRDGEEPVGARRGPAVLERQADAVFGPPPAGRRTRIMVTLPPEAAHDAALVARLVGAGMDLARINCAHDDAAAWQAMAGHVRAAARAAGREVRVLMDLGGPKLRVGPIEPSPAVLKLAPERDPRGSVRRPARLRLVAAGSGPAQGCAGVEPGWLAGLREGDAVELSDLRGKPRRLAVTAVDAGSVWLEGLQTCYLDETTVLRAPDGAETRLQELPSPPGRLLLQRGDRVRLVADGPGRPAREPHAHAVLGITLPEALRSLHKGQPVWFDDGRIGAVVDARRGDEVTVRITSVRAGGDWIAADKGVNLPETALDLPALTPQDLLDLDVAVRCADLVGLSFAQSAADVQALRAALAERGAVELGVVLKVETRRGFEALPDLLLAALAAPRAAVMIARGDLAVECGWERMAEVQEEILWACEAAHVPVVWATQVLESLAKSGRPSRAEITDAAMGVRAECVMLNKGPYVEDAIRALDDILRRMQDHQAKKRPLMRALRSW